MTKVNKADRERSPENWRKLLNDRDRRIDHLMEEGRWLEKRVLELEGESNSYFQELSNADERIKEMEEEIKRKDRLGSDAIRQQYIEQGSFIGMERAFEMLMKERGDEVRVTRAP